MSQKGLERRDLSIKKKNVAQKRLTSKKKRRQCLRGGEGLLKGWFHPPRGFNKKKKGEMYLLEKKKVMFGIFKKAQKGSLGQVNFLGGTKFW